MPEFEDRRTELNQARTQKEQARLALLRSHEQQKSIQSELTQLEQGFDPNNREQVAQRERLEERRSQAEAEIRQRTSAYNRYRDLEGSIFERFRPLLADPRKLVSRLSDDYPVLLLPVRLETRFKTVPGPTGTLRNELWVRVYPDDCAVDTFEPFLSKAELKNAQTYWTDVWRSGGNPEQKRGAWRGLVASHGSGRARWIVDTYRPLNLEEVPNKARPTDIVLTIATEAPLSQVEREALTTYWQAVWAAGGETEAVRGALNTALGTERAATLQAFAPVNLDEKPSETTDPQTFTLSVGFVVFPNSEELTTKQDSWSQAPKTTILPDCFVLIGQAGTVTFEQVGNPIPSPLVVGPDPNAPPEERLRQEGGELIVSDEMRWMVDFERAVEWGMGFRVPLDPEQARNGLDRLMVLGLKLSADEQSSKTQLETLLQHHHQGRSGFSLLPQGTPTNNSDRTGSGFSRAEDADASYEDFFVNATQGPQEDSLFALSDDWREKRDGQYLAEALGINPAVLKKVRHSDGTDQREARALNVALWPATLGYTMETMMHPVFTPGAIEDTRWFFTHHVRGRGAIPAARIGSQPYGILPTTAFSQIKWVSPQLLPELLGQAPKDFSRTFPSRLYGILREMDGDWANLAKTVSYVGKPGTTDAHKTLLDIIGLHSGSVEYHQRYAESLHHLYNRLNLEGLGGTFLAALIAAGYTQSGLSLLQKLGYSGDATPDVLQKFFLSSQNLLKGPVVDDRPLSETDPIRSYTADDKNYIQWLREAAATSLETLRRQEGFLDNKAPNALLYLFLRHALILGYWDVSLRLHRSAEVLSSDQIAALRREPNFVHVKSQSETSESRWQTLYKLESRITGDRNLTVADYIPEALRRIRFEARYLTEQLQALDLLKDAPTARLERVFAEHIDCCTYRFDAWMLGLVNFQLEAMRSRPTPTPSPTEPPVPRIAAAATTPPPSSKRQGLYLGAYGWLENVRPENKPLRPKTLEPELEEIFNPRSTDPEQPPRSPLMQDASNGGYIHAPSLNHAVTAAVLRNGYISSATSANRKTMAVNLSSERVRRALGVLEGIRGGQSLGALLGYQFERGLHDRHNLAEVDEFIYKLRKAFPLRADRLSTTRTDETVSIEAIEARNVMDGLSLVNHIKKTGNTIYPFGKPLPDANPDQAKAINAEANRLLDLHDAVADLALAESVHQAVQGNYDRAAATLDTYSKGNFPPDPEVVQTPRSGITLTHRVGLHLKPVASAASPFSDIPLTPRAQAEPALNQWLATVLPAPDDVGCKVTYADLVTGNPVTSVIVTQKDLQLQPIDLLYLVRTESQQAMGELDDRILNHVLNTQSLRPDTPIQLLYTERIEDKISFFELSALMGHWRSLILRSQPLKSSDITLPTANVQGQESVFCDRSRVTAVQTALADLLSTELTSFQTQLEPLIADSAANRDAILNGINTTIDDFISLMQPLNRFGFSQSGWGVAVDQRRQVFETLIAQVKALTNRWEARLASFNTQLAEYDALPPETTDAVRIERLKDLERLVASVPSGEPPAVLDDYRTVVVTQSDLFADQLIGFQNVLSTSTRSITSLLSQIKALLPITQFEVEPFELKDTEDRLLTFAADLLAIAQSVGRDAQKRLDTVTAQLTLHDNSANPSDRVKALQTAAQALLGDDFKLIPEFELAPAQGNGWQNAFAASQSGELFRHLTDTVGLDFPADDWLYGVARVREKMRHWEQSVMLTEGILPVSLELQPIQLPYTKDDSWLGLEIPVNYTLEGDRLLYTAHYAAPFDKTQWQCGLLLDEWTEVLPTETETTGLTFNYDRPNCEPPQTWLLVTPPNLTGNWQWSDLTGALIETLEMAKKRAVEPAQLDNTAYARFLPATIMAVTLYQISISANLALNNSLYSVLQDSDDE